MAAAMAESAITAAGNQKRM